MPKQLSILFVCQGNTCRSVMAEALARRKLGNQAIVSSAGISPQQPEDALMAIDTLSDYFNLDASGHIPRNVRDLDLSVFDYVIALSKSVAILLAEVPKERLIVWKIDDPWGSDSIKYKKSALQINHEISKLAFHETHD